jgi:hypothetical protein
MLRANFTSAISLAQKTLSLLHDSIIDKTEGQRSETSKSLLHFLQRQFHRVELQAIGVSTIPPATFGGETVD